jgi:hypothetical protein
MNQCTKSPAQFQGGIKRSQIEVLVLERPPQPLDENIVLHPTSTVHAHGDTLGFQRSGESLAGELSRTKLLKSKIGRLRGSKRSYICLSAAHLPDVNRRGLAI